MTGHFVLAQLSDTHFGARGPEGTPSPEVRFAEALSSPAIAQADALLLTGDLTDDGAPADYEALRAALASWTKPLFPLPGNHDEREAFRRAFADLPFMPPAEECSYVVEALPFRLIVWDVAEAGRVGGLITEARAQWLADALSAEPQRQTLLALHFPAAPTHDANYGAHGLEGAHRLEALLREHPQVSRVACGHMHDLAVDRVGAAAMVIAPSTAWRYAPPAQRRWSPTKESGPVGGLLHVWSPDAFTTHPVWL